MIHRVLKGSLVRNRVYQLTDDGVFYLYCFGRVTFSFSMGYLLIEQLVSGTSFNEIAEVFLLVLAGTVLVSKGLSRYLRNVTGLTGYDGIPNSLY